MHDDASNPPPLELEGLTLPDFTTSGEVPAELLGRIVTIPVDAEIIDLDGQKKVARYRGFEFHSDEPHYLGGTDEYPQPLTYLVAGIAFCLLTQVQRTARQLKKQISGGRCRVEFDTRADGSILRGTLASFADGVRIHLDLESPEPPEVVAHVIRLAHRSCFAEALVRTPIQIAHTHTVNGHPFDLAETG